ncbi:hypothetical protein Y1Q_0009971 [Alligator mississippiensis]|uniref:Uncharacterized protein n=1 Tax=Alligator mississippiensis TaxID=8496 RepID=A0A151MXH8_ALLMI|nr:hypothetical protein Y1Q_0009971 [Alligator mississippiensis]
MFRLLDRLYATGSPQLQPQEASRIPVYSGFLQCEEWWTNLREQLLNAVYLSVSYGLPQATSYSRQSKRTAKGSSICLASFLLGQAKMVKSHRNQLAATS